MEISLKYLKEDYDDKVAYVKRMIKCDPERRGYWKAFLYGVYATIDHIMQHYIDLEDFPKMVKVISQPTEENKYFSKVGEIEVFGENYNVYLDDYGQCYSLEIRPGEFLGLGTYNITIEPDIVYLVFQKIHDKNLEEIGD